MFYELKTTTCNLIELIFNLFSDTSIYAFSKQERTIKSRSRVYKIRTIDIFMFTLILADKSYLTISLIFSDSSKTNTTGKTVYTANTFFSLRIRLLAFIRPDKRGSEFFSYMVFALKLSERVLFAFNARLFKTLVTINYSARIAATKSNRGLFRSVA